MKPWLTDGAIEFLEGFLSGHDKRVLEFGVGQSTLWLGRRAKELVSVENKKKWVNRIRAEDPKLDIRLHSRPYHSICEDFDAHSFDLVLVDGRERLLCCEKARPLLRRGGVLMLDNAERDEYTGVLELLKSWEPHTAAQPYPKDRGEWQTKWWVKP